MGFVCHPGMQLNYSRIRWQPPCKEDFFRCLDGTLCNSKKKLCDGNKDCSYGEDELSRREYGVGCLLTYA